MPGVVLKPGNAFTVFIVIVLKGNIFPRYRYSVITLVLKEPGPGRNRTATDWKWWEEREINKT